MKQEKIFAFKGYGEYYFYNEHDLNCFWADSLEWCGGNWIDHSKEYVAAVHISNLNDNGMTALTADEYKAVLARMKETDKEFFDYLSICILGNNLSTEEFFGVTVKEIEITEKTKLSDYPNTEFIIDMADNDPFRVYLSDVIDNQYYGKYLLIK